MEVVSLKLEKPLLEEIDRKLVANRYATRTEFMRDAIREKLSDLDKEKILSNLKKLYGFSKKKTTDKELHMARQKAFEELDRELK
ncbi:hypothetical protein COV11_00260 [Candidatus Woesearchaeota archaeon CG10_big_fil_rev_8_21_14_0_10_30_7]|nr:MAG: hypothetical protein COV11_00260 [Candidatus Woesearchaeota archaeon CG10_big_fil_rev_8_21_14_0_10_30_7]